MKVLLLVWTIVLVLHCTTAKSARKTFTESEDNLLTDLAAALNIQTRDEPDRNDKIAAVDGDAGANGNSEDKNRLRDLAMEVRDLLKQDVVESLKRKLEDAAAYGDEDGPEGSLDTQARATRCGGDRQDCSNSSPCCSGLRCVYFENYGKNVCYNYQPSTTCRRGGETCSYDSGINKCCSGMYCQRRRKCDNSVHGCRYYYTYKCV